ncbi:hypothetical protein [Fimbriimonas ginsengisoli]|uniref:Uncharacterized protein n=1 Tax=Fimbriimonas ginsengisoli Gsoil 348 TaxID=661478 RepID=A0A068NYJ5_FIMGI|nr:hypothetical protein [Fimbriimonas ginsengisoli]AIE87004.1 hypothetical protein OP10G_3636 [Fimbriimonas ginsengisoli Gsoil 348]
MVPGTMRAAVLSGGYDPVVSAWIAAGGSASAATLAATDAMVKTWRRDGYFGKITTFVGMFGADLNSALLPLIGTAPTPVNFVSGDYSEGAGLTGNGTSKYLDSGQQAPGPATGGMGVYMRTLMSTAAFRTPIGSSGATDLYQIIQNSTPSYQATYGLTGLTTAVNAQMPVGAWHADRSSSTRLDLYFNGSSVSNRTTSTTPAANGLNVYVFGRNQSGSAGGLAAVSLAGYWMTSSLTAAEALAMYTSIQTWQTALGRNV